MIQIVRKYFGIVPVLAFLLACPDAYAGSSGGTITYGPATSIPTLSETMLVVLAFLCAVLAFRALRAHAGGKPLASLLAVGVLILAATHGDRLIKDAAAISYAFVNPGGGVLPVLGNFEFGIVNDSGQTQQILSVNPSLGYVVIPTSGSPQCTPGSQVLNNNYCYIYFGAASQ